MSNFRKQDKYDFHIIYLYVLKCSYSHKYEVVDNLKKRHFYQYIGEHAKSTQFAMIIQKPDTDKILVKDEEIYFSKQNLTFISKQTIKQTGTLPLQQTDIMVTGVQSSNVYKEI